MDSAAIPNLKELFRDEAIGIAALHLVGDKAVIHSEIYGDRGVRKLAVVQEVSAMIDQSLRDRGLTKLYTWATTDEQYRYNIFLGFKPTGEEVVTEPPSVEPIYEFVKEL